MNVFAVVTILLYVGGALLAACVVVAAGLYLWGARKR